MNKSQIAGLLALTLMLAACGGGTSTISSANLIQNPGAEGANGSSNENQQVASIPNWTRAVGSSFNVLRYDVGGGYPEASTAGPTGRGNSFFLGGIGTVDKSATTPDENIEIGQTVEIPADWITRVDGGQARFEAKGWFGGFNAQNDRSVLLFSFLSASDVVLGSGQVGAVSNTDRNNETKLLERTANGNMPANTRKVRFVLRSIHSEGFAKDGYADNLEFKLTTP